MKTDKKTTLAGIVAIALAATSAGSAYFDWAASLWPILGQAAALVAGIGLLLSKDAKTESK